MMVGPLRTVTSVAGPQSRRWEVPRRPEQAETDSGTPLRHAVSSSIVAKPPWCRRIAVVADLEVVDAGAVSLVRHEHTLDDVRPPLPIVELLLGQIDP